MTLTLLQKRTMKRIQKLWRRVVWQDFAAFGLTLAFVVVARSLPVEQTVCFDVVLVNTNDSVIATPEMVRMHNQSLVDVLERQISTITAAAATREQSKTQARLSYCAILAGAAALLANRSAKARTKVACIAIVLIIAMYAMDVHFKDVIQRTIEANSVSEEAAYTLYNSQPNNLSWSSLDTQALIPKLKAAEDESFMRKIKLMTYPDAEQKVYYLFPLCFLYFVGTWHCRHLNPSRPRKKTVSNLPNS